jgi:hypothetical protein
MQEYFFPSISSIALEKVQQFAHTNTMKLLEHTALYLHLYNLPKIKSQFGKGFKL